jgi:hypothetical protein
MALFDSIFGNADAASQEYMKQALAAYQQANVPTIASETVGQLPMQTVQGTVNPSAIQVATQAPSAYNNISLDPATRAAQMAALGQYQNIAGGGGLDAEAKLALQQTIDAANAQAAGQRGALQLQAQAEGQGGGDFALTQEAIANQGSANTAATQGLQTAAMAEANREAALNQMANIGGQVNASDYAQAQAKAAAQNAINATNQGYTNAANTQNVANTMNAGEFNVGTAQGVNAANTAAGQNRVYYNAALPQQQFNNELAKAGGISGVAGTQAGLAQNATNAQLGFAGSLLGAAGQIGAGAAGKPPAKAANAAHGGYTCYADGGVAHDHAICMKLGSYVPGKAKVDGDSETNDTVPAMLSPGELVIPRSVPKTGEAMEQFARNAPVAGDGSKRVDVTSFTKGYRRGK